MTASRWRVAADPDLPTWGSPADTGSMVPTPDAVAWSVRADAWSQQPEPAAEQPSAWQEPTNRWAEVAASGRAALPPDGIGWRAETAEWRAGTDAASWRTTTEWHSSTGTSGWRSTTEAWQAAGNAEGYRPPTEPPTRQPAISGTAWPTPQNDEQPWSMPAPAAPPAATPPSAAAPRQAGEAWPPGAAWQSGEPRPPTEPRPPWQAGETRPPWQAGEARPPWQAPAEPTWQGPPAAPSAPWQAPADATPAWQQPAAPAQQQPAAPTWQQPGPAAPAWQQPGPATPVWQQPAGPAWQQPAGPAWQQPAAAQSPTWQQPAGPAWQQPADPRASWQQPVEPVPAWQREQEGRSGWQQPGRQAPTTDVTPYWQQPADARPQWQQPIEPVATRQREPENRTRGQAELAARPGWQQGAGQPAWQSPPDQPPQQRRDSPGWASQPGPAAGAYGGSWSVPARFDDGRHLVREDDRAQWQRESAGRYGADPGPRDIVRRQAAEPDDARAGRGTGWAVGSDADSWAGHTDTGAMPLYQARPSHDEPPYPAFRDEPSWRRAAIEAPPTDSWRTRAPAVDQQREESGYDAPRWRETEPRPEPGRQSEARGERGPDSWQRDRPDEFHRDSDRAGAPETRPAERPNPPQRGPVPVSPARYREGNTEDWHRQLAAQREPVQGAPPRYADTEFPRFQPSTARAAESTAVATEQRAPAAVGSAAVAAPRAAPSAARSTNDTGARQELLVGSRTGGASWQNPPDTQWPPWPAVGLTGTYERRPVGTLENPAGRRGLLEPADDEIEEATGGPLAAVGYTVVWYGVPVVLLVLYMLVLDRTQQAQALSTLAGAAPQFGLSLALSMVVALGLRRASGSWKAASVGLAAAVMGGGLATVLASALTGQSLS